jgi:hypothetical protein
MTNRLPQKKLRLPTAITAIVLLVLAFVLIAQATIGYLPLGRSVQISFASISLTSLLIGSLSGYLLCLSFDKKSVNQAKKIEWQAQDEKLMASLASDKEKQLEAKIATLETALRNALKKQSGPA